MVNIDVSTVTREHSVRNAAGTAYLSAVISGLKDSCECTTDGPDGFDDLTIKFRTQEIVGALGEVSDRDTPMLTLTAELMDGSELEGHDCVVILKRDPAGKGKAHSHDLQSTYIESATPKAFALFQNHPNPFRDRTLIKYAVAKAGPVCMEVYDLAGVLVKTVVNGHRTPGVYRVMWEEMGLPSGVYFCRLRAGDVSRTRKMVVAR